MSETDVIGALVIGFAAGMSSGLLGVGGGVIFVPGLVFFLSESQLGAEATSLAAICVIALAAAGVHGLLGNVDVAKGLLVGIPAIGGVLAGTWLQQRIPTRAIAGLFAALLVVSATLLIL